MANLTGTRTIFDGDTSFIDTVATHDVGTRAWDSAGNEYIYLKGVASTVAGDWVTFNPSTGVTARVATGLQGLVAIARAATVASTYGWYGVKGVFTANTDTVAADKPLYIDGTTGRADDAVVAGDLIAGAFSCTADTSNVATVAVSNPFVTDTIS